MQTNYTLTPQMLRTALGVSKQRLSQLQKSKLKESEDFIKLSPRFFMYTEGSIEKLKSKIK